MDVSALSVCCVSVRPTVIETAVYVNSIGPVDPINMVSLPLYMHVCVLTSFLQQEFIMILFSFAFFSRVAGIHN